MRLSEPRYALLFLLLISHFLAAQRVLYSPTIDGRNVFRFSVAGKVGDNYWIQKEQRKRGVSWRAEDWMKEEQLFEVFDTRLQLLQPVQGAAVNASTLKKYLVCGNRFFDELILSAEPNQTTLQLRRYTATGELAADSIIGSFPFNEAGYSFLMTVSEDKTKTLLLGFESVPSSPPRLHAMVFDKNWKTISCLVYEHPFITQPFIQDDFFCFPSSINNTPVQLANNGEWLMASPSRTNHNFLLFHFDGNTKGMAYKEIVLPTLYRMEDIALSINNERGEAFAGILSSYRQPSHKNVHVTHYSFSKDAFDFDSSYRFSTLGGVQSKENTLVKESFIAVPDMGFMLLKEYGRNANNLFNQYYEDPPWDAEFLLRGNTVINTAAHFPINSNGYSRYSNTATVSANYSRGDLSIFYFPGRSADSCWSGFINKKQITELNAPSLSYLFVPLQEKLVLMYNNVDEERDPFGSTLELDPQGNQIADRELISWKSDQSLLFQQAVQITKDEVAVPYVRNGQRGFAIVRF